VANPGRRKRSLEKLSMLLEKADVQGYLTTEDLMELYPDVSQDADRFQIMSRFAAPRGGYPRPEDQDSLFDESEDTMADGEIDPCRSWTRISSDDTIGLYLKEMSRVPLLSSVRGRPTWPNASSAVAMPAAIWYASTGA
jgi:RNA polymerase primary sigma factor